LPSAERPNAVRATATTHVASRPLRVLLPIVELDVPIHRAASRREIPDRGCPATAVTNQDTGRSAIDGDVTQRDRSCLGGAVVEPDRS